MQRNKESDTHAKYLAVYNIIKEKSDHSNPISIKQIAEYLNEVKDNTHIDHKHIADYVKSYNDLYGEGTIESTKNGRYVLYHYTQPPFDLMEAKAIVDLVYSSYFFTATTKECYKQRITALFPKEYKKSFDKILNLHVDTNQSESAFYNELEAITEAISNHKMISFTYQKPSLDLNTDLTTTRTLAPIDTCFANNEYYLLCQGDRDKNICISYRLDYISNVKIITESNVTFSEQQIATFNKRLNNMTYMYSEGELESIELIFDKSVYSNIIDKFGQNIICHHHHDAFYTVTIKNTINSTFYSWIIGFGGKIKILGDTVQLERFQRFLNDEFLN